ncbi:MAG TPA: hypothetical protein VGD65_24360 [Chryseosolibacter sp.]
MNKVLLLVAVILTIPKIHLAQSDQEIAAVKMIHNVYKTSGDNEPAPESLKSKTNLPTEATDADINACVGNIAANLSAKADNMPAGAIINGKDPGRMYVVRITAPLAGCPAVNEMAIKGKWKSVKTQGDQNILSQDIERIDRENRSPIEFNKLNYLVLVDQKEGDTPVKVSGTLDIGIPAKLKMIELTAADVNKEHIVGEIKVKLLEMKGSNYKLELSNAMPVKIMPLNASQQEFSSNMTRNIPVSFYKEFAKKDTFTDEEYKAMFKSYDKQDTRVVKLGTVSGTIQKILVYIPDGIVTKQIPVELGITK